MEFAIKTTWDNESLKHEPVKLRLEISKTSKMIELEIAAPFFNSPSAPCEQPGANFDLWNYEGLQSKPNIFFLLLMIL